MFSNPVAALGRLSENPSWFLPLLLAAVWSVAVNFYLVRRIGFVRLMSSTLQANAAFDRNAVIETALAHRAQILTIQWLLTFAGTFLTALVVAKVLWLVLTVVGKDVPFRSMLAVVAHVTMLTVVVKQSMLALTATVIGNLDNLNLRNPLATNPAFFFDLASPVAVRVLTSLDVITLANILLLALGLTRVVHGLSFRAACIVVTVPWGAFIGATLLLPFS
jgi:hypothetical protein